MRLILLLALSVMGQFPTDVIVAKTTPYAPYLVSNATLYENAFGGQVVDVQAIVNPQPGPIRS